MVEPDWVKKFFQATPQGDLWVDQTDDGEIFQSDCEEDEEHVVGSQPDYDQPSFNNYAKEPDLFPFEGADFKYRP